MKHQIATNPSQSARLIACGVNPDTADMCYLYWDESGEQLSRDEYLEIFNESFLDGRVELVPKDFGDYDHSYENDSPAWSLSALLELLPQIIDNCWLTIQKLKNRNNQTIHGEFTRTPMMHKRGYGCPKCRKEDNTIYGVGVSDIPNIKSCRSYQTWIAMLERCYGNMDRYNGAYKDCSVCEEWHLFSNFNRWFEESENGYQEGYALDKDILVKGNRVYSPQNCCFVPPSLNSMMSRGSHKQREYPIGVIKCKSGRYRASYQQKSLGMFDTPEEAFCAYKAEKETNIKKIAASLFEKGEITHKVYDALMRYEVEITD